MGRKLKPASMIPFKGLIYYLDKKMENLSFVIRVGKLKCIQQNQEAPAYTPKQVLKSTKTCY